MGIDKDIKQAKFRNNQNKAMVNIMFTHAWMLDHIKSFVKTENITPQQYNILRILRSAGEPLSTLQLRERMLDKMSDTSRIVERMVAKGLVQKAVSEKDKRMVDVILTDRGVELLENLDRRNEELDAVVVLVEGAVVNKVTDSCCPLLSGEISPGEHQANTSWRS